MHMRGLTASPSAARRRGRRLGSAAHSTCPHVVTDPHSRPVGAAPRPSPARRWPRRALVSSSAFLSSTILLASRAARDSLMAWSRSPLTARARAASDLASCRQIAAASPASKRRPVVHVAHDSPPRRRRPGLPTSIRALCPCLSHYLLPHANGGPHRRHPPRLRPPPVPLSRAPTPASRTGPWSRA